jgi:hypothetical protein
MSRRMKKLITSNNLTFQQKSCNCGFTTQNKNLTKNLTRKNKSKVNNKAKAK